MDFKRLGFLTKENKLELLQLRYIYILRISWTLAITLEYIMLCISGLNRPAVIPVNTRRLCNGEVLLHPADFPFFLEG